MTFVVGYTAGGLAFGGLAVHQDAGGSSDAPGLELETCLHPCSIPRRCQKSVKKALPAIPNKRELATLRNAALLHHAKIACGLPRCDELAMIWPVLKEGALQSLIADACGLL